MSLVGIRDMSVIETPPRDRLSIQTQVVRFESEVITRAIRTELERRRPGVLRAQPGGVDLLGGEPVVAARAGGAGGGRARPDGRTRARAGDGRLRRAQARRAGGDDDRRERPRHPECEHDHRQSRGSVWTGAAVSAARARRTIGSARLRVSADSSRSRRCRRLRGGGSRRFASSAISAADSASPPSTSRSAAPATSSAASRAATSRRSASTCTSKLLEADDPRAEGRGAGGRPTRRGQPPAEPAGGGDLYPGHEPAPRGVPPDGQRAGDWTRSTRFSRSSAIATAMRRRGC